MQFNEKQTRAALVVAGWTFATDFPSDPSAGLEIMVAFSLDSVYRR
jgi:hypothetical protein